MMTDYININKTVKNLGVSQAVGQYYKINPFIFIGFDPADLQEFT